MNNIKKVLNFWKLCELSDIDRFTLDNKKSPKPIGSQSYLKDRALDKNLFNQIKYAKISLSTVYFGLTATQKVIERFQNCLKDSSEFKDMEFEKLKSNEYTYIAKFYANTLNDSICLEGCVVHINPIFYILKNINNLEKLDNHSFEEYNKEVNEKIMEKYPYDIESTYIFVPDEAYFKNMTKYNYKNILSNPFNIEKNKLYIAKNIYDKLKSQTQNEKIQNYIKQIDEYEGENVIIFETNTSLEDEAIKLAYENSRDFVYLCSRQDITPQKTYPINFTISTYLKGLHNISHAFSQIPQDVLLKELQLIGEDLGVNDLIEKDSLYVLANQVKNLAQINNILDTNLVSFYIKALEEKPSELTEKFILGVENKKDVNGEVDIKKEINDLSLFENTPARWVSKYSPNYAQQAAINLFLKNYGKKKNIFSVNGPPGTGKTTLLKDIIANIVVQKAQACIDIGFDLFEKDDTPKKKNEPNCQILTSNLSGKYEIFVVSNNNLAVENISLELPKIDSIDFDYIGKTKEDFALHETIDKLYEDHPSWGLISARLGNSSNISKFKKGLEDVKTLKTNDLTTLENEFSNLKQQIKEDEDIFRKIEKFNKPKIEESIINLKAKIKNTEEQNTHKQRELEEISSQMKSNEKDISLLCEEIDLKMDSLGFIEKSFIGKIFFKSKHDEILSLREKLLECKKSLKHIEQNSSNLKTNMDDNEEIIHTCKQDIQDLQKDLALCDQMARQRDYFLPNDEFFSKNYDDMQLNGIYQKQSYQLNKAKLFFVSMQILEALYIKNMATLKENIKYYFDNKSRKYLSEKEKKLVENGFYSLFFITPVVSSSLASTYNMLQKINKFGTLLCDESGQATPQSLVCALNRAQNALIVGDPLQVEPVFTAPASLINSFQSRLHIDDIYNPLKSSAQKLADLANSYGSYYQVSNKKEWVGMPLVIHRRCINPMFSISNKISYNDKMVLPKDLKADESLKNLPQSCWIDVVSNEYDFPNDGNSSIKEKEVFEKFLKKYYNELNDNFYVISPFKTIYNIMEKNYYIKTAQNQEEQEKHIGTIHTFQGRESPIVFFLLGGNIKREGSKEWVANSANILNVAVTRAKQKIYILGDFDKWKELSYFDIVTSILPKFNIDELM